jgi:hypothetical protein
MRERTGFAFWWPSSSRGIPSDELTGETWIFAAEVMPHLRE